MIDGVTRRAVAAFLALMLASCASARTKPAPEASTETSKTITVSLVKLDHDIAFQDSRLVPDERQDAEIAAFLAASEDRPGDHVFVLAGSTSLDGQRADALVARLRARGSSAAAIRDSSRPAGVLRIVIERYVATARDCPDWSRISWANFDNLTSPDFGCATNADLAAMVADPHDLIAGATMGPVVGDPAVHAVERYRSPAGSGASTGLAGALGALIGGQSGGGSGGGAPGGGTGP